MKNIIFKTSAVSENRVIGVKYPADSFVKGTHGINYKLRLWAFSRKLMHTMFSIVSKILCLL